MRHVDEDGLRARDTIATGAPRKLRLEELLAELGAHDGPAEVAPPRAADQLTVGELVDKAAEGGFAALIAVLALIAIPFVGVSTPFGLAIALLGLQMVIGLEHPWLPARVRRRPLPMVMLDRVATMLARRTRWLVKATRRRHEPMVSGRLVGVGVLLLAIGLALPLPIPGSNFVFLVPLMVYAIGLLERDGVWVAAGHLMLLADLALLFVFGSAVVAVLERVWGWLT